MASVEKQSLNKFKSQEGESNAAYSELYTMTQSSSLRNEILEAIESQIRYIASQIATPSVSDSLRDGDGNSDATSQDYPSSSEDDQSLSYETSASDFTAPNYPDKERNGQRFSDVCGTSVASLTISMKLSAVDRSTCRQENDTKSEITLPSYTEMCGDEENVFAANGLSEDTESNVEENVPESGDNEESPARLPGCFGDYKTGKLTPTAANHYRYIGKQRPNYEEFEDRARQAVPARVPPADSTAVDFETSVARWLSASKGKAEVDMPDNRFPYESDITQSCSDSLPRLSSSAIDISSKASSNRKRKLGNFESEAGLESSRSEIDICRAQPRRLLKRRKISGC